MASRKLSDCDKILQDAWLETLLFWEHPCLPFLTCTHRSNQEQAKLYAIGRTVPGRIVTYAKPGQSKHNHIPSLAFDVAFKNPGGSVNWDVKLFRLFAGKIKLIEPRVIWGGDFRKFTDYPHFEL